MKNMIITIFTVSLMMCVVGAAAAAGAVTTLQGTLSLGGSEPLVFLQLKTADGGNYKVIGPAAEELRSVGQGYVVRVVGVLSQGLPIFSGVVEAYQYEIVSVRTPAGDKKPVVGRVMVAGDGLYLVTEDLVVYRLQGPGAEALRARPGAKVAVVGETSSRWSRRKWIKIDFFNILKG